MKEWTWTVGNGGFVGKVSLLEAPLDVAMRLQRLDIPVGFVAELFVHPHRRRAGWANTLMDSITKHADREKIDLWTYVEPFGADADRMTRGGLLAYYARWGFCAVKSPEYEYEIVRQWRRRN